MAGAGNSPRPRRGDLWSRIGAAGFLTDDEKRAAVGYGAKGGEGKGGWMGPDPIPGDRVATPGGIGTTVYGGPSWTFGPGSGGEGHWVNQPRVPAGNPDGGQWTADGGVISGGEGGDLAGGVGDDDLTTGAGGTSNMNHAARMLNIDRITFGDMIHALKEFNNLSPRDNVLVQPNGDILFKGKVIDNIWNYKK